MDITDQVNHMLQQHGYELLHVGQKTVNDSSGKPWQMKRSVKVEQGVKSLSPTGSGQSQLTREQSPSIYFSHDRCKSVL
jgi:hypothetical protein